MEVGYGEVAEPSRSHFSWHCAVARSAKRSANFHIQFKKTSYDYTVIGFPDRPELGTESMEESVQRIEPARLVDVPETISDAVAELSAASATLGNSLHPLTSQTPKGPVSLRFPVDALDILFPRLFPET